MTPPQFSTKVTASALAGAVSTLFWILMVDTVWQHTFSPNELSTLVASTTTILAFLIGFLRSENGGYIREWVKRNPNRASAACAEMGEEAAESKDNAATKSGGRLRAIELRRDAGASPLHGRGQ